jgi:hypothetical protein
MHRMPEHAVVTLDNRLVKQWSWRVYGRTLTRRQGKRVSKDCVLSAEERRAYVMDGPVAAIKCIRNGRKCGLREAYDLLQSAK